MNFYKEYPNLIAFIESSSNEYKMDLRSKQALTDFMMIISELDYDSEKIEYETYLIQLVRIFLDGLAIYFSDYIGQIDNFYLVYKYDIERVYLTCKSDEEIDVNTRELIFYEISTLNFKCLNFRAYYRYDNKHEKINFDFKFENNSFLSIDDIQKYYLSALKCLELNTESAELIVSMIHKMAIDSEIYGRVEYYNKTSEILSFIITSVRQKFQVRQKL